MEPSNKNPQISAFLEELFGRTSAITNNRCIREPIGCGKPITPFRDELSEREYRISGLCQNCQDLTFTLDNSIDEE